MVGKQQYLKVTSFVLLFGTQFFHERGFDQLMPVMLSPITDPLGPDPGSSVIKTGEIEYLGQRLCLTQSMILHKQLAIKSGTDRLFILSPNVRLEHPRRAESGKHLFEFTQLDFELARGGMEDVFGLMEEFLYELCQQAKHKLKPELTALGRKLPEFERPFPRYTTDELRGKYGDDWEMPASTAHTTPFWAISHKREFYDRDDPERPACGGTMTSSTPKASARRSQAQSASGSMKKLWARWRRTGWTSCVTRPILRTRVRGCCRPQAAGLA